MALLTILLFFSQAENNREISHIICSHNIMVVCPNRFHALDSNVDLINRHCIQLFNDRHVAMAMGNT